MAGPSNEPGVQGWTEDEDAAESSRQPLLVQSVTRAAALLSTLAGEINGLRLSEIAARTGLNISTAHRLLSTLQHAGFIAGRTTGSDRYVLGPAIVPMFRNAYIANGFAAAQDVLERLVAQTGESAAFSVRDGLEVVVMLHLPSPQPLRYVEPSGSRAGIRNSAVGRVLLAHSDKGIDHELDALIGAGHDDVTSAAALALELRKIRREGVCIITEEQFAGMRSTGAPVIDSSNRVVGGVATIGPLSRMTDTELPALIAATRAAADEIGSLYRSGVLNI